MVSRNVPANDTAVISVGIQGGSPDAPNVMPAELYVGGTMRAFTPSVQALLERRIPELAELAAQSQGATVETELWWNAIPLVNPEPQTRTALAAAAEGVGADPALTRPGTGHGGRGFRLHDAG